MTENTNHELKIMQLKMELTKANDRADDYSERLTQASEVLRNLLAVFKDTQDLHYTYQELLEAYSWYNKLIKIMTIDEQG